MQFEQRVAAIDPGIDVLGIERERSLDADKRLIEALKIDQGGRVIVVRVRRRAVELKRRADEFERAFAVAALLVDQAEEVHGVEMLRRELQDSGVEPFGVIEQPALLQRDTGFYRLADRSLLGFRNRVRDARAARRT